MMARKKKKLEPVYLHMEIDDWEPCYMNRNDETGAYEITRAVPRENGKLPIFFISYRGKPVLSDKYKMVAIE